MKKAFPVITEYLRLFMLAACIGWLYEIGCVIWELRFRV